MWRDCEETIATSLVPLAALQPLHSDQTTRSLNLVANGGIKMTGQTILTSSIFASLFVFIASRVQESMAKNQKALGMLNGILLEIDYGEQCACAYLKDSNTNPLWSPAYRIAVDFCQSSIPWLATERKLSREEVAAIHRFYICATEMTRCLDALADQCSNIQSAP